MPRAVLSVLLSVVIVVAVGLPAAAAAVGAPPMPVSWVNLYQSPADQFFPGSHQLYVPSATTQISVTGTPTGIKVSVTGPQDGFYGLSIAPAEGNTLTAGYYGDAQPSPTPGRPTQNVGVLTACYSISAEFQIEDIAFVDGHLTRLDIAFDQRCDTNSTVHPAWLYGEVSYDEPSSGPLLVQASSLLFPAQYVGVANLSVPLSVTNVGVIPTAVGRVTSAGIGADDIAVNANTCPSLLEPGATCTITVTVTPRGPGVRSSVINVGGAGPSSATVLVNDSGIAGNAAFILDSEPGEWIGSGFQWNYNQFNGMITGVGSSDQISFTVNDGLNRFDARIVAPAGHVLAVGHYPEAARAGYETPGTAGLDISASSRGCNAIVGQFDIREIEFDDYGRLSHFAADVVQRCDGLPPLFVGLRFGSSVPYSAVNIQPDPGRGSVTFPSVVPGNASPRQVVNVVNVGAQAFPATPAVTGVNADDFKLTSSSCAPGSPMSPGDSCSVSVSFAPHGFGLRTAALVFIDGTVRGQHTLILTGTGAPAPTFTFPLDKQMVIDTTQAVSWITSPAAQGNYLVVGTGPGAADIVNSGVLPGNQLSYTLPIMPIGIVYATVFTELGGRWTAYQSITFQVAPLVASFTYPLPGLLNVDATRPITWATNSQDQGYVLVVGTSPGSANLINSGILPARQNSYKPPPMPADTLLYATLFTELNGRWNYYQTIRYTALAGQATFTSPLNGQRVTNVKAPYTWTTVSSVQGFYLVVGTT
ncbi:MAG: hypothetical protein QOG42_2260, partial [Solirubrobacteraceae bacterium]|nr:hypothetical protein [Solirubrobacteraceae bacterium]